MNEQVITKDNIKKFTDQCFDKDNDKAASIVKGILDAKSPRISDISNEMEGNPSLITRLFKGSWITMTPEKTYIDFLTKTPNS